MPGGHLVVFKSGHKMKEIEAFAERVVANVEKVIVGKRFVIELALVALLCEGHILIEDVPGVGKTMLARALAISIGGLFKRIQCTPDLLPSDVTGVSVYNQKSQQFDFLPGPVMANVLLADEINRATPRTQSSLLECMGEQQITVDGVARPLLRPFIVMATQNPIEYEGTFPLPEAQLDRFLLRLSLGYPDFDQENTMLVNLQLRHPIEVIGPVAQISELTSIQQEVRTIFLDPSVRGYLVKIVEATRSHHDLTLGASPRGSLALFRSSQALAAVRGRDFVIPDDVKELALPALGHRLILRAESRLKGRTAATALTEILEKTEVPIKG